MQRIETLVLENLIYDEEYTRKVLPFLTDEYFSDSAERILFNCINDYINEYDDLPAIPALEVIVNEMDVMENDYNNICEILENLKERNSVQLEWLIDETEEFCKKRAIYNSITVCLDIIEGKHKNLSKDSIPDVLSDALSVSFDSSIGHDYFDDAEDRHDYYNNILERLPFDIDLLNKITRGGIPSKTLSILIAGCVHPDTLVDAKINDTERTLKISEINELLKEGFTIHVDSPDGYVKVKQYVDKGEWDEYVLNLDDGTYVRVNENHLFETTFGWQLAKDLSLFEEGQHFLTKNGYVLGFVDKTDKKIPIVDIEVEHENHRYYTNGVSSHNTGVGKTIFLCNFAAHWLMSQKNVLYITNEMAEERIAERIDSILLDVEINEVEKIKKSTYLNTLFDMQKRSNGKLIIKEYPMSSSHAGHYKSLLKELKIKKKFVPDVIIVDYLNICLSKRFRNADGNSYGYIKAISEELRALATEFDVPIFTATQINRCLDLNTELFGTNGTIQLKDIKEGDLILGTGHKFVKVTKVFDIEEQECYEIETYKSKIICSGNHIFPTLTENKTINDGLKVGDMFTFAEYDYPRKTLTESLDTIVSIKSVGIRKTIDISVSDDHLFYANGILTHNSGHGNSDFGMDNTAESFGINFTADMILACIETEQLAKMNQIMIKQLKNRFGSLNYYSKFLIGIDKSKMKIYNLEDDAQKDLSDDSTKDEEKPVIKSFRNRKKSDIKLDD